VADLEGGREKPQVLSRAWVARGLALVVAGFGAGFLGYSALADSGDDPPAARPPTASASPEDTTPAPADGDDVLRRAVGQKIITRMAGERPSPRLLQRVRRGEVGGVILFDHNAPAPTPLAEAAASLQKAAARGGNPRLLIAVDQEGGSVRRLPWAPPQGSAAELGGDPARALSEGERTGRTLRRVGINVDLAPVLDVPAETSSVLGSRAFGTTPEAVSRAGCAFAAGLRRGGVLTAAKHFPGLGDATANTDKARVEIRTPAAQLRAAYRPYRDCLDAGVISAVMVANAVYPALGARVPPALSGAVIEDELRGRLRFRGVVISDTLQAGALRRERDTAVRAARAGVDLLLYPTTERASEQAYRSLLAAARAHPAWVTTSARRIRALKATLR